MYELKENEPEDNNTSLKNLFEDWEKSYKEYRKKEWGEIYTSYRVVPSVVINGLKCCNNNRFYVDPYIISALVFRCVTCGEIKYKRKNYNYAKINTPFFIYVITLVTIHFLLESNKDISNDNRTN